MLLIIQNGFIPPSITKYLTEEYEIVKSFEINVLIINLEKYSLVIILGGHQSVTNIGSYPYLLNVVTLIKNCISIKKPLLGICLGCQLVAYALGCEIKSSGKLNIGYDTKILGLENIFRSHIDYIEPNPSIDVLEYYDSMVYLFRHGQNVVGIQCHPDITPECIMKYHNNNSCINFASDNKEKIDSNNNTLIKYLFGMIKN